MRPTRSQRPLALEVTASVKQPLGMSSAAFLRDYWQQRPLLVRGAFAGLAPPLTPEDLAGLACEELALARLVTHTPGDDRWNVRSGPFEESDFATLPESHWTLLVQDVDKWDADVAALLERFDFLPNWRIDDIMVSYAVDGGSVGAHVDQYDVFLLQGLGRRRWRISTDARAPKAFREDVELKLLSTFAPTDEWLLEPGDMLYLPPGVAHHGVAEGACLTFSIGMRAPAVGEMLADFGGYVAEKLADDVRYTDPGIVPARHPGEIDDAAIDAIAATLRDALALDADVLRDWFGGFITRYRSAHDVLARPQPLSASQFDRELERGSALVPNPWSRFAWTMRGGKAALSISGESHRCARALAIRLSRRTPLAAEDVAALGAESRDLLRTLVNAGHLGIARPRRKR